MGQKNRTVDEQRKILSQNEIKSSGWAGDSMENEWSQAISEIVDKKTKKMKSNHYKIFPTNWLIIYDNTPYIKIDFKKAFDYLFKKMDIYWNSDLYFESIFIERGDKIFDMKVSIITQWNINNLWN